MSDLKIVPLVSSGAVGPLGAAHLPRLWTKLTLHNAGMLPDGFEYCGAGFDQMTISALGLDRDKVIAYVRDHKPTYVQFEEYVVAENGGSVSPEAIAAHNAAIHGYHHSDELGGKMREATGLKDHSVKDAVRLNFVEDLDELHAQVNKG